MKTHEEIKKGLEKCSVQGRCKECPYYGDAECVPSLSDDALAYIQQLEAQVPKWISVEERLPDDLEEVLILVKETEFYGQLVSVTCEEG